MRLRSHQFAFFVCFHAILSACMHACMTQRPIWFRCAMMLYAIIAGFDTALSWTHWDEGSSSVKFVSSLSFCANFSFFTIGDADESCRKKQKCLETTTNRERKWIPHSSELLGVSQGIKESTVPCLCKLWHWKGLQFMFPSHCRGINWKVIPVSLQTQKKFWPEKDKESMSLLDWFLVGNVSCRSMPTLTFAWANAFGCVISNIWHLLFLDCMEGNIGKLHPYKSET